MNSTTLLSVAATAALLLVVMVVGGPALGLITPEDKNTIVGVIIGGGTVGAAVAGVSYFRRPPE